MLIDFSIENWQSFRNKVTLSMSATRERQHGERIAKVDKYGLKLLPAAAIYGGNASGKTKLFNALAFAKQFVVKVTQPGSAIPREHFMLDSRCAGKPSKFTFTLLIDEECYEFSFSVTQKQVVEEKLAKVLASKEEILYYRKQDEKIKLFPNRKKSQIGSDDFQRLKFVAEGTRDNQLFLTNSVDQKITHFQKVYEWFKNRLTLIAPDSLFLAFGKFIQKDHFLCGLMNDALSQLDTGIVRLGGESISIENLFIPEDFKMKLMEDLMEGESVSMVNERIILTKRNGALIAEKLVSYHKSFDGHEIPFNINQESAGTLRMMDILPCFFDLFAQKVGKIYVIDELDRRLHTLLTRALLERYFQSCSSKTRSQLLFTTHDGLLFDQKLLRRDEIWVTERDNDGCTSLTSLSEYKDIRLDKDIRKSYLRGHLGGIPKIRALD